MVKTGFKPKWEAIHTQRAKEYEEKYMGKVPVVGFDEYMKWLDDAK